MPAPCLAAGNFASMMKGGLMGHIIPKTAIVGFF